MKKLLEYDAIDSLTALELPDRTMTDTFVQVIVVFPVINFAVLDGNNIAVLNNLCIANGNIIGSANIVTDNSGNTWVMCWQDNSLSSDTQQQVDQTIIANNGNGTLDISTW